jgi:Kef-type K+ transport system membrane component KefB
MPDVLLLLSQIAGILVTIGFLSALSQIGLVFFMFLIGLELDLKLLRGPGRAAVVTSHAGIIAPFFLGACLALVTTFMTSPVLARIYPLRLRAVPRRDERPESA